jgi:hypothetical protein
VLGRWDISHKPGKKILGRNIFAQDFFARVKRWRKLGFKDTFG